MASKHRERGRRGRPPKSDSGPTRERLLGAALQLFAEKGFAATTVREIAALVSVRDSAIYAHFESKQALFDALMAEAGPALLGNLGVDLASLGEQDPADAIPELFGLLVQAWDKPRIRQFTSVVLRDGASGLPEILRQVQARLRPVFASWAHQGRLRSDISTDLLMFELLAPLATIRLVFLNGQASEAERAMGRSMATGHLDYFVMTAVRRPRPRVSDGT